MEQRGHRLTDAFVAALELRKHLREGTDFCTALADLRLKIEMLEDGYPEWHPVSYPFRGMLKLFLFIWKSLETAIGLLHAIQNLPTYSVSTKFLTSQSSLERGAIVLMTMFVGTSLPVHTA